MNTIDNGHIWCRFKDSLAADDIYELSEEHGGDWGLARGYLRVAFNMAYIRKLENTECEDFKHSICVSEKALKLSKDFLDKKGDLYD